jgi:polar amino acid transport system substrate-binding protein
MRFIIHLSLLCLSFLAEAARAGCSHPIRVGWNDFPPFVQAGTDGVPVGLDADLMRTIFKRAGCTLEFVPDMPNKRQTLYMQSGEIDMQFDASEVKERHAYAWYSLPYRREIIGLFVRKGEAQRFPIHRLNELASHDWQVLVPYHGFYGQALEDVLPQLREHRLSYPYVSTSQGVEMLYHKRADLLVGDYYSSRYAAKEAGLPEMETLPVPVNDNAVHLIFSKRTVPQADVALIDAAIQKLEAEGELRRIAERYGLQSNEPALLGK